MFPTKIPTIERKFEPEGKLNAGNIDYKGGYNSGQEMLQSQESILRFSLEKGVTPHHIHSWQGIPPSLFLV